MTRCCSTLRMHSEALTCENIFKPNFRRATHLFVEQCSEGRKGRRFSDAAGRNNCVVVNICLETQSWQVLVTCINYSVLYIVLKLIVFIYMYT